MVDYREILRLHSQEYTQRQIAVSVGSSRNTVNGVLATDKLKDIFFRTLRLKIDVAYPNGFIWPLIEPFGYIHLRLKQLFKAWCTVVHLFIFLIFEGVQLYTLLIWII